MYFRYPLWMKPYLFALPVFLLFVLFWLPFANSYVFFFFLFSLFYFFPLCLAGPLFLGAQAHPLPSVSWKMLSVPLSQQLVPGFLLSIHLPCKGICTNVSLVSPFISPYSSPCSGMISTWVCYQLQFEQAFSPYPVSALPATLVWGTEDLSKPCSHVRYIFQTPLPPSPAFLARGF